MARYATRARAASDIERLTAILREPSTFSPSCAIHSRASIAASSSSEAISARGRPCSRESAASSESKSSITAWAMRRM